MDYEQQFIFESQFDYKLFHNPLFSNTSMYSISYRILVEFSSKIIRLQHKLFGGWRWFFLEQIYFEAYKLRYLMHSIDLW